MTVDLFDDEMFEEDPPEPRRERPPRKPRRRGGGTGETAKRVIVVIPWIAVVIAIVVAGGLVFAAAMIAIGALCVREYLTMTGVQRPLAIPAYLGVAADFAGLIRDSKAAEVIRRRAAAL